MFEGVIWQKVVGGGLIFRTTLYGTTEGEMRSHLVHVKQGSMNCTAELYVGQMYEIHSWARTWFLRQKIKWVPSKDRRRTRRRGRRAGQVGDFDRLHVKGTGGSWPSATSLSWCNACLPAQPSTNCCSRSRENCGRSRGGGAVTQRQRISNATTHDWHPLATHRARRARWRQQIIPHIN